MLKKIALVALFLAPALAIGDSTPEPVAEPLTAQNLSFAEISPDGSIEIVNFSDLDDEEGAPYDEDVEFAIVEDDFPAEGIVRVIQFADVDDEDSQMYRVIDFSEVNDGGGRSLTVKITPLKQIIDGENIPLVRPISKFESEVVIRELSLENTPPDDGKKLEYRHAIVKPVKEIGTLTVR